MSWEEYAEIAGITDIGLIEKWKRQFPDGPDSAPDSFYDSLGRDRRGNKKGTNTTNIDVTNTTGDLTGTTDQWPGTPDVLPQDRESWLDFIAPAGQGYKDIIGMGGVMTGSEDAITAGTISATDRLRNQFAGSGNTGMHAAMQSAIELGGIGQTAQSRQGALLGAYQGIGQLGGTYADLLHQQRPVAPFGGQWGRRESDIALNRATGQEEYRRLRGENEDKGYS